MSARKPGIRLTPRAARDFENILAQTEATWGIRQAERYQAAITSALRRLRNHPQLGQRRDDLAPGYRGIRVEHHVIYYDPQPGEIVVLRILHSRQDPIGKVEESPS
jgi:toxin ParE1/3/4